MVVEMKAQMSVRDSSFMIVLCGRAEQEASENIYVSARIYMWQRKSLCRLLSIYQINDSSSMELL